MPVTSYYTAKGILLGEADSGTGVRTDYMVDAVGSITGTIASGSVGNTYTYKPYGDLLDKTGTVTDPRFRWAGSHGYQETGRLASSHYVRARHFDKGPGRWTTVDPVWPEEPQFGYVYENPVSDFDPTGLGDPGDLFKIVNFPNYGKYCGMFITDLTFKSEGKDCIDKACKEHDRCLRTADFFHLSGMKCHKQLCNNATYCQKSGTKCRKDRGFFYRGCYWVASEVKAGMCLIKHWTSERSEPHFCPVKPFGPLDSGGAIGCGQSRKEV